MRIQVTILVEPIGKARARYTATKDGRVFAYTPKSTRNAEAMIQAYIRTVVYSKGVFAAGVPLKIDLILYRPRPKSLPKRVKIPVSKPDWDNSAKLVTDALEKFVYNNDSQISDARVRKRFGDPPRIELVIEEDTL